MRTAGKGGRFSHVIPQLRRALQLQLAPRGPYLGATTQVGAAPARSNWAPCRRELRWTGSARWMEQFCERRSGVALPQALLKTFAIVTRDRGEVDQPS